MKPLAPDAETLRRVLITPALAAVREAAYHFAVLVILSLQFCSLPCRFVLSARSVLRYTGFLSLVRWDYRFTMIFPEHFLILVGQTNSIYFAVCLAVSFCLPDQYYVTLGFIPRSLGLSFHDDFSWTLFNSGQTDKYNSFSNLSYCSVLSARPVLRYTLAQGHFKGIRWPRAISNSKHFLGLYILIPSITVYFGPGPFQRYTLAQGHFKFKAFSGALYTWVML